MLILVAHKDGKTYRKHFKHPSVALEVFRKLKKDGFEVHIYRTKSKGE